MENQLYIRVRGRVLGPYDQEKLHLLARRGQFSRAHEISDDGLSWVRASTRPELFGNGDNPNPVLAPSWSPEHAELPRFETHGGYGSNRSGSQRPILTISLCAGVGVAAIALLLVLVLVVMRSGNQSVAPAADHVDDAARMAANAPQQVQPPMPASKDGNPEVTNEDRDHSETDVSGDVRAKNQIAAHAPKENKPESSVKSEDGGKARGPADDSHESRAPMHAATNSDSVAPAKDQDNSRSSGAADAPHQPPPPPVESSDKGYITSVKNQEDIRAAVALVVVGVDVRHDNGHYEVPLSTGSAFAIGSNTGIMLTNRHVVQPFFELSSDGAWKKKVRLEKRTLLKEKLWVFIAGKKYSATLLHTSAQFDFAIIQTPVTKKSFRLKLAPDGLFDVDVRAIGFPGNAQFELSEEQESERISQIQEKLEQGRLAGLEDSFLPHARQFLMMRGTICQDAAIDNVSKTVWLQHNAGIAGGSSGGPLVLPDGTAVGINTQAVGSGQKPGADIYRAVSVGQLRSDIDRFAKDVIWVP